jgi:hypothetical protein
VIALETITSNSEDSYEEINDIEREIMAYLDKMDIEMV